MTPVVALLRCRTTSSSCVRHRVLSSLVTSLRPLRPSSPPAACLLNLPYHGSHADSIEVTNSWGLVPPEKMATPCVAFRQQVIEDAAKRLDSRTWVSEFHC